MRTELTLIAAAALATLTACGGGGSANTATTASPSGNGSSNPPATGLAVSQTGSLQMTVPASSYVARSFKDVVLTALNSARFSAGAGELIQSSNLDVASDAHAKYLTDNQLIAHNEDASKLSFYAVTPVDRAVKAGFSTSYVAETIGGAHAVVNNALVADPTSCVFGMLDSVYHSAALLSTTTHVGVGQFTDSIGEAGCVIDPATPLTSTYGQVPASGTFVAYPFSGQTGVYETFYVAYESPRPSATLFPNTTAGTPVVVSIGNADYVNASVSGTLAATVTQFVLKDAGGNVVPSSILTEPALVGSGVTLNSDSQLSPGFAVLVPLSPLAKGTTYTVNFAATIKGGAALAKTWSFTTN